MRFLPALSDIKTVLDRNKAAEEAKHPLTERSYNPWDFPADVRALILEPAQIVEKPIACSHALVDAVSMPSEREIVIPLANYTLEPIARLDLVISSPKRVARAASAVHGALSFKQPGKVELSLPLENNDFVMLWYE